jgi:hypothetical protein
MVTDSDSEESEDSDLEQTYKSKFKAKAKVSAEMRDWIDDSDDNGPQVKGTYDPDDDDDDSSDNDMVTDDEFSEAKERLLQREIDEGEKWGRKDAKATVKDVANRPRITINNPDRINRIHYIEEPDYKEFSGTNQQGFARGGRKATVILGPAGVFSKNSNARSTGSLPALGPVRATYQGDFVAGHLLNADFGGVGTQENITVLTDSANGSMNTFDNRIRQAVNALKHAYVGMNNLGIEVDDLTYGIEVEITVGNDTWDDDHPGDLIANEVTCTASVHDEPDVDDLLEDVYPDGRGKPPRFDSAVADIKKHMQAAESAVDQANNAGDIDNT